jgi:hypothetical protein
LECSFLESDPNVGTGGPEDSGVGAEGRIETRSAWAVGKPLNSEPSPEREVMSELRDVHHSPEGSVCMRAYFRFRFRSGDVSRESVDLDGTGDAAGDAEILLTTLVPGLAGMSVSRSRTDCGTWKEDWSRRERARLQNLSCCAAGAEGRERG